MGCPVGYEQDEETGWTDFMLRSYDAQTGRFLQNDPFDEFASGYAGMGGDPGNLVDPTGGCATCLPEVVVTATVRSTSMAKTVQAGIQLTTTVSSIFTYANTRGHQFITPTNYGSSTQYLDETWSLVKSSPPPGSGGTGTMWKEALEVVTDIAPFAGSGKDLFRGIRDGNLWQIARGIGGLALDIGTLGTGSLIKGGIITTFKYGGVLIGLGGRKALGLAVHGNSLRSLRPTWGYKLYSHEGKFLKNGITSRLVPESRYTKAFMSDKYMEKFPFRNRLDAWKWEFQQNKNFRGPLNKNMH